MKTLRRWTPLVAWITLAVTVTLFFVEPVRADGARPDGDDGPRWTLEFWIMVSLVKTEPATLKGGDPAEEEPEIDPFVDPRPEGRDLLRLETRHGELVVHFFGAAAQMMRRLLVDHARMRQTAKRGAGAVKLPLSDELPVRGHDPEEMLVLDEALDRLQAMQPRQARVMELKSFTGLTNVKIAKTLGVGLTVVKSDLRVARAWLAQELRRGCEP